jgi:hypothetical protein
MSMTAELPSAPFVGYLAPLLIEELACQAFESLCGAQHASLDDSLRSLDSD